MKTQRHTRHAPAPPSASQRRTAPRRHDFEPEYAPPTFTGDAVRLIVGTRAYSLPTGSQAAFAEDERGRIALVLLPDHTLHVLTTEGEVMNVPDAARDALAEAWFGT